MEDFLKYFNDWKQSVKQRQGEFRESDRSKMMLSHQTLTGLKLTVNSIVECVRFSEGAQFVLTHKFNQDPLEEHFGHYRHKGGSQQNPTIASVQHTMTNLRAVGSQAITVHKGNVKRDREERKIDCQPLHKKSRKYTKKHEERSSKFYLKVQRKIPGCYFLYHDIL